MKDEKDQLLAEEEDQKFRRKFRIAAFVILIFGGGMLLLSLTHLIGHRGDKIWMLLILLGIVMFFLLRSELVKHFKPEDAKENIFGMKYVDFDQIRKRLKEEEKGAPQASSKKHSDEAMRRKALGEISKMKNEAIDKMAKSMLVSYAIGKEIMFKSKGLPEDEVFKGLLEDIKVICKRENVPDEWSIEVTEALKRKVEEYRSMDEKHSTEMIKLIMKELQSARGKVSEESR